MEFMDRSQREIRKRRKGESLRAFMAGALIATVKAPVGGERKLQYVAASGRLVPIRRWTLSGVPMVTRSAWVNLAVNPPRMAGWRYALDPKSDGFVAQYQPNPGSPYAVYEDVTAQFGNCAAPKLLRALFEDVRANRRAKSADHNAQWNVLSLQLTEMRWHPDEPSPSYETVPSCTWCRQLLPQMLCMRATTTLDR